MMHVQFVTDEKGKKKAVQLSMKQWDELQKSLKKLEILEDLKTAYQEMEQYAKGKVKSPSTKQLLAQL